VHTGRRIYQKVKILEKRKSAFA